MFDIGSEYFEKAKGLWFSHCQRPETVMCVLQFLGGELSVVTSAATVFGMSHKSIQKWCEKVNIKFAPCIFYRKYGKINICMDGEQYIFKEPSTGRKRLYRPWEATPLDLRHPKVRKHQEEVRRQLKDLIINGRPETVSFDVAQYIHGAYAFFDAKREARSIANFNARDIKTRPKSLDPKVFERSMLGTDSIEERRMTAGALDMLAAELAMLSYFYGHRAEHIPGMETDVSRVLGELALSRYKVDTFDTVAAHRKPGESDLRYDALILRTKSKMYIPQDGTVLKRSDILFCRVDDELGLTQEAAEVIVRFHRTAQAQQDGNGAQLTALKRVYPDFIEPIVETGPTHPAVMGGIALMYEHKIGHKDA